MNNNAPALLRLLVIYAVCVPLAVIVGYMLANPLDYSMLAEFGILAFILVLPILLKWHHWLLLLSWNLNLVLFFFKGSPPPWLAMAAVSLLISVLQRALSRQHQFISVPVITWH